jgi:hypothetical protein
MLYLQHRDYSDALPLFSDLAALTNVELQPKARGLAGQVVIYWIQGDQRLAQTLAELMRLTKGKPLAPILGQDMRNFIRDVFEDRAKTVQEPGRKVMQDLLNWLDAPSPPGG